MTGQCSSGPRLRAPSGAVSAGSNPAGGASKYQGYATRGNATTRSPKMRQRHFVILLRHAFGIDARPGGPAISIVSPAVGFGVSVGGDPYAARTVPRFHPPQPQVHPEADARRAGAPYRRE